MTTITEPGSTVTAASGTAGDPESPSAAFVRLGAFVYLGGVAVVVLAIVAHLGGRLIYVLDDPAIHLSVAEHLVRDGTWGVSAGSFESASSSPLWTLLVAPGVLAGSVVRDWIPLVLNVAAGVGVIVLLGRNQTVIRPSRGRPLDVAVTVLLVIVVLFLPGLAVVGMEHTLHMALVLAAVVLVHRRSLGQTDRLPSWAPLALVALGTTVRFETAFVALGLAVAVVAAEGRAGLRRAAALLAASAVPIAALGILNRAMGGGWLPNSILAKGQGPGGNQRDGLGPVDIAHRLTQDPILAGLFAVAVVYLVLRWGREAPSRLPAITLVVATAAHVVLADVGWYERYQAYLIAIGVYALLRMLAEVPTDVRRRALISVLVLAAAFGVTKINLMADAPRAADDMYRHHYQAARFLDRYYDDAAVATDQLGYISLLHDGPLTDLGGLGDYEVLEAGSAGPELWDDVTQQRGTRVVVIFDSSIRNVPEDWVLAGQLELDGEARVSVTERLQFYATTGDEVEPLQDHLAEFEADLPARVELQLNEFAGLQVWQRAMEEAGAAGS
jgi:hypothetical protein